MFCLKTFYNLDSSSKMWQTLHSFHVGTSQYWAASHRGRKLNRNIFNLINLKLLLSSRDWNYLLHCDAHWKGKTGLPVQSGLRHLRLQSLPLSFHLSEKQLNPTRTHMNADYSANIFNWGHSAIKHSMTIETVADIRCSSRVFDPKASRVAKCQKIYTDQIFQTKFYPKKKTNLTLLLNEIEIYCMPLGEKGWEFNQRRHV